MRLEAHGLAYGHGDRIVGRGVDLALDGGQALCVLGPNGAGKTTLLRTMLGILPALAGRVSIGGEDAALLERSAIARRIAYVPQASPAVFEFSVEEIVGMGRLAHLGRYARPSGRDAAIATNALRTLGIADLAERPFGAISGGERQLVLIARALAAEAGCIVLDEPTAQLDYGNQARVIDELMRLRDAGIAILLSTHEPDHALMLADQALLLRQGGAIASGPANAVLNSQDLSRLYGVAVVVTEVDVPGGARRVSVAAMRPRQALARPWR